MTIDAAIITTFPNDSWDIYAKEAMASWVKYLPKEVPILVQLDNDLLANDLHKILHEKDAIAIGWEKDHLDFVNRNRGKDDPRNYRKQAVRFCHKVFAIRRAYDAIKKDREAGQLGSRYLIWMDADVILNKAVTTDDLQKAFPKDGDAVSYLGRTDWEHSECGWLVFDLDKSGGIVIENAVNTYTSDAVFNLEQWHDSWVFDRLREQFKGNQAGNWTNLTDGKPGMDIWPHSPMGAWSTHFKGPQAKANLANQKLPPQRPGGNYRSNVVIQTKNAIPDESIKSNIATNQILIKNWVMPCKDNDEEVVIVSAGPLLVAEDVRKEEGKRIVAVKHALEPLKKAGIKPWACILLDPRPHVVDFVKNPDKDVIWFVASQVQPEVTKRLLEAGCTVWGYHASVGANEQELTDKQAGAVIHGGSATSTRGMFLLAHLGFKKMKLYGYDLCYPDKPDMNAVDTHGQPKYLEMSLGLNNPLYPVKKCFWSEPQLIAQFEELNEVINTGLFKIEAEGDGIIPFILRARHVANLRNNEIKAKMKIVSHYGKLLGCSKTKRTKLSTLLLRISRQNPLKLMMNAS